MKINSLNHCKKYLLWCIAIAMTLTSVGCESLTTDSAAGKKKKKDANWFTFKKKEYQAPQSVNVTWTHDILTLPGKPATRGFGGRFYFYNEKTQAIPVDGELTVYGFDDTHGQQVKEDLSQATKRFRFTAEQFTSHFTEGELGASYSVWIPWDAAYGGQKKIMLIPTFMTKDERMIRGAAASLNLPGKSSEDPNLGMVQQASSVVPTVMPGQLQPISPSGGSRSTTIQLPSRSLRRQSQSPEVLAALADLQNQSQPFAQTYSHTANQPLLQLPSVDFGSDLNATPITAPNQNTSPTSNSIFAAPPSMPVTQTGIKSNNSSGWAMPEFAPVVLTGLSPRSVLNSLPAPASQAVQSSFYPTR